MEQRPLTSELESFLRTPAPRSWADAPAIVVEWQRAYRHSGAILRYLFGAPILLGWGYLAFKQVRYGLAGLPWSEVAVSIAIYSVFLWLVWLALGWPIRRIQKRDR